MSRLVVSRQLPLVFGKDHAPTLGAEHDLVFGRLEVVHGHLIGAPASREERGLVADVLQVGAREPGRPLRDIRELHVVLERELPGVHL